MYFFPCLRKIGGKFHLLKMETPASTLVRHIIDKSKGYIGTNFFARLQVHLRNILDPNTQIYANGFKLQTNNQVAILLLSSDATSIDIIIQTTSVSSISPSSLWHQVWKEMQYLCQEHFQGISLDYQCHCPTCVIEYCGNNTFDYIPLEILNDTSFSNSVLQKMKTKESRSCKNGHLFSKNQLLFGKEFVDYEWTGSFTLEMPFHAVPLNLFQSNEELLSAIGDNAIRFCCLFPQLETQARFVPHFKMNPLEIAAHLLLLLHQHQGAPTDHHENVL